MTTFDQKTKAAAAYVPPPRPLVSPVKGDKLDLFVRAGITKTFAHLHKSSIEDARRFLASKYARYDEDAIKVLCDYVARGAVAPATTYTPGWAADLVSTIQSDVIQSLIGRSAFAQLASMGLSLNFGRAGRITVPSYDPSIAGAFVREGEPIPVGEGLTSGPGLTRKKMAVITAMTREITEASVPAIETLLRVRIQESTGIALDTVLLDDQPANDVRPAGLLHAAVELTSSGGLQGDLQSLAEGVFAAAQSHVRLFVLIANPAQAFAARLGAYRDVCPIITSPAVPPGTVIMLDAADFACAGGEIPRWEISAQAALHMETDPRPIVDGAPSNPVRSLWQTDSLALKMVLDVDWTLRRPGAVSVMHNVFWQSGGGGGGTRPTTPTYVAPLLSLSGSAPLAVEIGTGVVPTLTPTWAQNDAGDLTAYRLTRNGTQIFSGAAAVPHTDTPFNLTANTTYVAAADHDAGPIKNDSDGNPYTTGRIQAGTRTSNSVVYTPQRMAFFGPLAAGIVPSDLDDPAFIRALAESSLGPANNSALAVDVPNGAHGAVFAYPATLRAPTSIVSQSTNIDVKAGFTTITVAVPGANGFTPINYRVMFIITDFPFGGTGDRYTLTI